MNLLLFIWFWFFVGSILNVLEPQCNKGSYIEQVYYADETILVLDSRL